MKHAEHNSNPVRSLPVRIGAALGLLLSLGLLAAMPASASYEQVGTFAANQGNRQLLDATGMAVNSSGAGGVPAGTLYAVAQAGHRVIRYSAKGEFREAWGWGVADLKNEFQRCGPDGEAAHPTCGQESSEGGGIGNVGIRGDGASQLASPEGIAVDQATGNVYVLNRDRKHGLVEVFSADGSQLIAAFGEPGVSGETFDEGPDKIHKIHDNGIAVDTSGAVYVYDETGFDDRVMLFEPQSPGDYEHYVYAGRAHDIATYIRSQGGTDYVPGRLALDSAGNLYTSWNAAIYEFAPAGPTTPVCEYRVPGGGATGMTVNAQSGEVFYFSEANRKIHLLSACNLEGEFEETETLAVTPKTGGVEALAFNPTLPYDVSLPPGILYAADGSEMPEKRPQGHIYAHAPVRTPVVESQSVFSVTSTTATLGARIKPEGSLTSYAFQYLTEAEYEANEPADRFAGATQAPLGGAVLGSGQVALSATTSIVGLEPDTEYRYRVNASSHCDPGDEAKVCETTGLTQVFHTYPTETPGLSDRRAYELVSPAQKHGGEVFPADPGTASCDSCKPGEVSERFPMQSSPDGEAVVYEGFPFSSTEGAANFNEYLSKRTASGWQTTILSPMLGAAGSNAGHKAFNAELTRSLIYQLVPSLAPDAPSEFANLYAQGTANPLALSPLLGAEPPNRSPGRSVGAFELTYAGASADFSRIFFEANDALTAETPFAPAALDPEPSPAITRRNNLYEWVGGGLRLVNVLPGNAETVPGAAFGKPPTSSHETPTLTHAISDDGSRAFWSSESGQVYVRVNGLETQAVSESQRNSLDPLTAPVSFLTASADGSRTLLTSSQELTDDADTGFQQTIRLSATSGTFTLTFAGQTTAPLGVPPTNSEIETALEALPAVGPGNVTVTGPIDRIVSFTGTLTASEQLIEADGSGLIGGTVAVKAERPGVALYEWHEGSLSELTAGHGQAGFQGIVGQSEDLSRIYFVDTAVLTGDEENDHGAKAQAGEDNLYAWHGGESTFVATLLSADNNPGSSPPGGDWMPSPVQRTAEASPDGRYLAFMSYAPLTGYKNNLSNGKTCGGNAGTTTCTEVFLYDSATGKLTCPSCNSSGAHPLGSSILRRVYGAAGFIPQPRYLTDSGRLYFDSADSLSPFDTNDGVEDVYQYEPQGIGSCKREGGCVSLISAGHEPVDSNFLAADASGENVFFTSRDQLVLKDRDDLIDLYDAREGGGIASETETGRSECQGEACQPALVVPNDPTPGSSSFEGAGNVVEKKSRRKHQKKHKHRAAKRHHKRAAKHNRGGAK